MTPTEFAYWLQGYLELGGDQACLDAKRTQMVRRHLALVFENVTLGERTRCADDQAWKKEIKVDDLPTGALARYEREMSVQQQWS
jgi:hypothetical protein